jgi:hypothetical protein
MLTAASRGLFTKQLLAAPGVTKQSNYWHAITNQQLRR